MATIKTFLISIVDQLEEIRLIDLTSGQEELIEKLKTIINEIPDDSSDYQSIDIIKKRLNE